MSKKFSLDHLSDTDFEEYCFDLIKEWGFKNVDWRKGTGKSTSPSDNGRDIEAERIAEDFDGETIKEKWFFECKHYKEGVPPDKIQGALSWANVERPEVLVIICSNFLSNPCKESLKKYIRENKPAFKIREWELKELEQLSFGKTVILNKYKLSDGLDFINDMHPFHMKYVSKPHHNTLDYFFSILDTYDVRKRDEILGITYHLFIAPRYKKPITGKETMGELQILYAVRTTIGCLINPFMYVRLTVPAYIIATAIGYL
ncbi:MAG: restriction endonuclease [Thermoplasmata archaeon]